MGHATLGGRVAACALALLTCSTFFPGSSFAGRDKRPPSTPSNLTVAGVTATGFTLSSPSRIVPLSARRRGSPPERREPVGGEW